MSARTRMLAEKGVKRFQVILKADGKFHEAEPEVKGSVEPEVETEEESE